jgi:hypothetical protein
MDMDSLAFIRRNAPDHPERIIMIRVSARSIIENGGKIFGPKGRLDDLVAFSASELEI